MPETINTIGIDARLFGTAQAAGIGQYAEELVRYLVKHDAVNQYKVFVTGEAGPTFPIYAPNLTKLVVPFRHYTYSEQFLYPNILKRAGLDLIHYTNFNTPIFFRKIKSVVTIHDLTLWFFPGRKQKGAIKQLLYRIVIGRACRNANHIIAITEATKQDIVKWLKIDPAKITVVYEAASERYHQLIQPANLEQVKRKFNITKPYFLYTGQWRAHKNVIRLIRAFALLRRRYQLDHQLVLVGKVDSVYPQVMATIKELGLQDDVVLTGYVADDELPYLYNGADCFVFPSLYEGFGLPPLEAMACGAPVVSSNVSCMPEVLGDAAIYFDPLSVEDMAKAMAEVGKNYTLKRELRAKGLRQAKLYSFDRMAEETLAVYRKVLQ
ncbi:MAG: glycosyltransferase family 1 protein [Patescibacteria group bacterium]|jgi:glycosyltransferase involved in cell wall biosynthesis